MRITVIENLILAVALAFFLPAQVGQKKENASKPAVESRKEVLSTHHHNQMDP